MNPAAASIFPFHNNVRHPFPVWDLNIIDHFAAIRRTIGLKAPGRVLTPISSIRKPTGAAVVHDNAEHGLWRISVKSDILERNSSIAAFRLGGLVRDG